MAYLIAEYIVWMMKEKVGALKVYAWVMAVLTIILDVAYLAVRWGQFQTASSMVSMPPTISPCSMHSPTTLSPATSLS